VIDLMSDVVDVDVDVCFVAPKSRLEGQQTSLKDLSLSIRQ